MSARRTIVVSETMQCAWADTMQALIDAGRVADAANGVFLEPDKEGSTPGEIDAACAFLVAVQRELRTEWATMNGHAGYFGESVARWEQAGKPVPRGMKAVFEAAVQRRNALWTAEQHVRACRYRLGESVLG